MSRATKKPLGVREVGASTGLDALGNDDDASGASRPCCHGRTECPGPVRAVDGRWPGVHDVPRGLGAASRAPVASDEQRRTATASHGCRGRGERVAPPAPAASAPASRPGRSTPRPRSTAPQTNSVTRLAGRRTRSRAAPPRPRARRSRARASRCPGSERSRSHGARTSSAAPSYHLRAAHPPPVAGGAGGQRAAAQQPDQRAAEAIEPSQGYAATTAAAQQRADDEQRRPPGPFGERRRGRCSDRQPAAEACGGGAVGRSRTVWCSVSSLVPARAGRPGAPGSSVGRPRCVVGLSGAAGGGVAASSACPRPAARAAPSGRGCDLRPAASPGSRRASAAAAGSGSSASASSWRSGVRDARRGRARRGGPGP